MMPQPRLRNENNEERKHEEGILARANFKNISISMKQQNIYKK